MTDPTPKTHKDSRRSVVFVGAATAFSLLGDQALYAVLPVYYQALGLGALEVGILLSANRWIRLLTNDLAHRLSSGRSRRGSRLLFVGAFALGVVTTLLYGLTTTFGLLLGARLAWGLAWSFIRQIGVQSIMAERGSERAGRTMGLYNGISRAGSVVGLLGGAILVDLFGFATGMLWLALISLLSLPLAGLGHRLDHGGSFGVTAGRLPLSLRLSGFCVGVVGPGFVMSTLGAGLVEYVAADALFSAATLTGVLLAARYAMDVVAAPWLGGLTDRQGVRRSATGYFVVGGVALLLASLQPPLILFMGLVLLFFGCGTGLQAGLAGSASRLGAGPYARYVTASDLGAAVGPLLGWLVVGWLEDPLLSLGLGGGVYLIAVTALRHNGMDRKAA